MIEQVFRKRCISLFFMPLVLWVALCVSNYVMFGVNTKMFVTNRRLDHRLIKLQYRQATAGGLH